MCNTEQNYVGKGDSANDSEQSANTAPSILSTAGNQPNSTQHIVQVYEAQTKLLALIKDFISCHGASSPVEVVNDLLFRWLTLPSTDLSLETNRTQLLVAQQLVNFLTELSESAARLDTINDQFERAREVM